MQKQLSDEKELLFRQIHPDLLDGDVPASSNFKPKPSDENMLSVDRASLTTAAKSFDLYIGNGRKSAAVYALSVGEFATEKISCRENPIPASEAQAENSAHTVADFSNHVRSQQDKIAKRLKQRAIARGRQHPLG